MSAERRQVAIRLTAPSNIPQYHHPPDECRKQPRRPVSARRRPDHQQGRAMKSFNCLRIDRYSKQNPLPTANGPLRLEARPHIKQTAIWNERQDPISGMWPYAGARHRPARFVRKWRRLYRDAATPFRFRTLEVYGWYCQTNRTLVRFPLDGRLRRQFTSFVSRTKVVHILNKERGLAIQIAA